MKYQFRILIFGVALSLGARHTANAQGTLEDYRRAARFESGEHRRMLTIANVTPHWIEKTSRFWYRNVGPKESTFLLVDSVQNTSVPAFDHSRLAQALSKVTGQDYQPGKLPFETLEFAENESVIKFSVQGTSWACRLGDYTCEKTAENAKEKDSDEALSPDRKWSAFLKDHNLFVRYVPTGAISQMTWDGAPDWDYAIEIPTLAEMVHDGNQNVKLRPAAFWSPDSAKLVTYHLDSRRAGRFTALQYVPQGQLRPKAFTYAYPLPGEVLSTAEPFILDIRTAKLTPIKTAPLDVFFNAGPGFSWFEDGKSFFYDIAERGFKAIEWRVVDAETGDEKVLLREQSGQYVDPGETSLQFLHASGEMVLTSERDGWNHIYLYNQKTGKLVNQLTQGPWVVHRIEATDEKNRKIYFLAGGREKEEDPYQTHLYSVGFDGKGLTLLSPENANHAASLSPDSEFFVDNYSRPDLPGASVLRRTKDGSVVRVLANGDATELLGTGWRYPESFHGKSADGKNELYGLMWKPSSFDPSRKYPVIEHVYTGPQAFFTPKSFHSAIYRGGLQAMAELGAIVVMVDGRGTTGRSRAFHEFSYRNLGGSFADHVAMIKQMADKYPFLDANRVGIYGTSAGGYGAAHAMLEFPDFYKVGVSISGDQDARLDKTWWNELYQGYPVQDDYVRQSNVTMANRLEGHLLIEHGDLDDNVNPAGTMRFADALMKANKSFDMLFVPNMAHGERNSYLARRRWDYFVQNLLGVAPPHNFEIKEAAD